MATAAYSYNYRNGRRARQLLHSSVRRDKPFVVSTHGRRSSFFAPAADVMSPIQEVTSSLQWVFSRPHDAMIPVPAKQLGSSIRSRKSISTRWFGHAFAESGRNKIDRLLVWFITIAIALVAGALIFAGAIMY